MTESSSQTTENSSSPSELSPLNIPSLTRADHRFLTHIRRNIEAKAYDRLGYTEDEKVILKKTIVQDIEMEAAVSPQERGLYTPQLMNYAEELISKLELTDLTTPEDTLSDTIIVDKDSYYQLVKTHGLYEPGRGRMFFIDEEGTRNRKIVLTNELCQGKEWPPEQTKYTFQHELAHALSDPDCPVGLQEAGAQYYSMRFQSPQSTQKLSRLSRSFSQELDSKIGYKIPLQIYENLVSIVGEKEMQNLFFRGNMQAIDNLKPEKVRDIVYACLSRMNEAHQCHYSVAKQQGVNRGFLDNINQEAKNNVLRGMQAYAITEAYALSLLASQSLPAIK